MSFLRPSWTNPALWALHVLAPFVAIAIILGVLEAAGGGLPSQGGNDEESRENVRAAAVLLSAALLGMVLAWRKGLRGWMEPVAVLAAWTVTLLGFVLPLPQVWMVLPAFLLPWLLLVVELPERHRVILLLMQWLGSAMLLETWTQEAAGTTALFALGLLHLVLVWATLAGQWKGLAVTVGTLLSLVVLGASGFFFVTGPTLRRAGLLAVGALMLAVTLWLARSPVLARFRLPTLVYQPAFRAAAGK